jgi:nitrate reductase cytochrome c-type subunit
MASSLHIDYKTIVLDKKREIMFNTFKKKNTIESVESLYREIYKFLPNKIVRIQVTNTNNKCHQCVKKAVFVRVGDSIDKEELLCWLHGIKVTKNN